MKNKVNKWQVQLLWTRMNRRQMIMTNSGQWRGPSWIIKDKGRIIFKRNEKQRKGIFSKTLIVNKRDEKFTSNVFQSRKGIFVAVCPSMCRVYVYIMVGEQYSEEEQKLFCVHFSSRITFSKFAWGFCRRKIFHDWIFCGV